MARLYNVPGHALSTSISYPNIELIKERIGAQ